MLVSTSVTSFSTVMVWFLLRSLSFLSFCCLLHAAEPSFLVYLIGDGFAEPAPIFLIIPENYG